MPRAERHAKALRRTVWELLELSEEDRAWILGELSPTDRARLIGLISEGKDARIGGATRMDALDLSGLDDWLYLRALAALDLEERRAVYDKLPTLKRAWVKRKVEAMRTRSELTSTASAALLESIKEVRVGGTV